MKKWIEYLKNNDYALTPGRYWKAYKDYCIYGIEFMAVMYDGGYRIELKTTKEKTVIIPEGITILNNALQSLRNDYTIAMILKEAEEEKE